MVAIVSHKREAIHRAVRDMYTEVASSPERDFHFPTGRDACIALGYPSDVLEGLPRRAVESFAGVGYPFAAGVIRRGDRVLDIGSGSGTDALISARLAGPEGRVYGLDMTAAMRQRLRAAADEIDGAMWDATAPVEALEGDAENIPLPDDSVDVVTTNGVLNLVPDKAKAIAEIFRVLKPGGRLQIADIALTRPVSPRFRQDPQMWAECVVGAVEEERYLAMLRQIGFEQVRRLAELDYFGLSSSAKTREVAGLFNAHSIALAAVKPAHAPAASLAARPAGWRSLAGEWAGVGAAVFAWLACAGFPAILAVFGALGVGALAGHAFMFPAYAGLLGLSVWLIWRTGWRRQELRPFWLAAASAVFATGTTWLALTGIAFWLGWWSYLGVAGVLAASAWSHLLGRRPGVCAIEMIGEARWRDRFATPAQRLGMRAATTVAAAATLYGLYASVVAFSPA